MRTSNIILLALALVICATVTALAVTLRVKADHHSYTQLIPADDDLKDISLGTFSTILVDNMSDVNIRQGNANLLRLSKQKEKETSYRLQGDTLSIWSAGSGSVRIVVQDLRALSLMHMGECNLSGVKGDSLFVHTDGSGNTGLDSCALGSLHLGGAQAGGFSLSNSTFKTLWSDIDSTAILSLQNDRVERIVGKWGGEGSLQIDAATLRNGIQKIEHIQ